MIHILIKEGSGTKPGTVQGASAARRRLSKTSRPQRRPSCCPPRICSSTSTCSSMTRSPPATSTFRPGQGRRRPVATPSCSRSRWSAICWAGRSEAGFLAEVARDWAPLFPRPPHQSEVNRRIRWLSGAFEQLRATLAAGLDVDDHAQVDTSALPVKHPSRVRGPDGWVGPNGLVAGFGRDAAHAEWCSGFRLAVKTDLGSRLVRAWSIVPAAVNEREVATDLLETGPPPRELLADKGFNGRPFAATQTERGTAVLTPPTKTQRARMPSWLRKVITCWRNRVETTFGELTDRMELARHGAHTFWGLLTRTTATIAAHTLLRACRAHLEVA